MMGDYNTTFEETERIGTSRSSNEKSVANRIMRTFENLLLRDCWEGNISNSMTWRHGTKMSRLDRIWWSNDLDS